MKKHQKFYLIIGHTEVCADIFYTTINKLLVIKVGKLTFEVRTSYSKVNEPVTFMSEEFGIKFTVHFGKTGSGGPFKLDVQDRIFESLPYRAHPICLTEREEDEL